MRPWSTDVLFLSTNAWIFVLLSKQADLTQETGLHPAVSLAHPGTPCFLHIGFLQLSSWMLHNATTRQLGSCSSFWREWYLSASQIALQKYLLLLECTENPDIQCSVWVVLSQPVSRSYKGCAVPVRSDLNSALKRKKYPQNIPLLIKGTAAS